MKKVYISDMHELKLCNRGIRPWFAARGLNYSKFLKYGIDIEILRKYCDECGHCKSVVDKVDSDG